MTLDQILSCIEELMNDPENNISPTTSSDAKLLANAFSLPALDQLTYTSIRVCGEAKDKLEFYWNSSPGSESPATRVTSIRSSGPGRFDVESGLTEVSAWQLSEDLKPLPGVLLVDQPGAGHAIDCILRWQTGD